MNAPERAAPMEELVAEHLPVTSIRPSQSAAQQLRRKRYNQETLLALAANIGQVGVMQPILVRPIKPQGSDDGVKAFEIVAGERRWLAADRAGLAHVPAIIRDLADAEALALQLTENIQRESIHPLEEAEGFHELMQARKINADQLGDIIGKSRSYVYARTKLRDLCPEARDALQAGTLDASKALLLARVKGEKQQAKALAIILEKNWRGEPISYKEAVEGVRAKCTADLRAAPFALDDAELYTPTIVRKQEVGRVVHPACVVCPHNSENDPELRDELKGGAHICTNTECFHLKVAALADRRRRELEAAGRTIITGEDAKKIAPRKDALVGHVDLDASCIWDEFPEEQPQPAKGEDEDSPTFEARLNAWHDREEAWVGRSYRTLLAGAKVDTIAIEDPKTKKVRELAPVKVVRALLAKQHEIKLPGYVGEKPRQQDTPQDHKAAQEKYERERKEAEAREAKERTHRRKVLAAIAEKCAGPLTRDEIVDIADMLVSNHNVTDGLKSVYGKIPEPSSLKDPELGKLIRLALVADSCGHWMGRSPAPLLALAKRYKIDPKKIRAQLEAADKPKPAAKADAPQPKPAAKAKKKAAKK